MSWNTYVETLENSGNVKKAAICGLDGSLWAASSGWTIKPEEVKTLNSCFSDKASLYEKGNNLLLLTSNTNNDTINNLISSGCYSFDAKSWVYSGSQQVVRMWLLLVSQVREIRTDSTGK